MITPHPLVIFSNVLFDVTHISLDLSDHRIAGTSSLQFDDKQLLLVLTDGEQINRTRIRRELLPTRFPLFHRGHGFCQEECWTSWRPQEVLKVLLQSKDRGVLNGWVLTNECLGLRLTLDQLL